MIRRRITTTAALAAVAVAAIGIAAWLNQHAAPAPPLATPPTVTSSRRGQAPRPG